MSRTSNTRVRWALASWLFVLSAVAFLDRTNVSIAGLQISKEYALGNQRVGWMASAFLIASLTPWIAQHFGWTTSFTTAAGFAVLSAILWTTVHPERPLGGTTPLFVEQDRFVPHGLGAAQEA